MMTTSSARRPGKANLAIAWPQATEIRVPTAAATVE